MDSVLHLRPVGTWTIVTTPEMGVTMVTLWDYRVELELELLAAFATTNGHATSANSRCITVAMG